MREGLQIEVTAEKPASGGRMIARHDGRIVLVSGAIPGERVSARVTRADKRVAFADTEAVLEPSPDRRDPRRDPACGGCVYAHIQYPRQVELKAEIIRDAFLRIGRIPFEQPIIVRAGEERGYRMRARFHVHDGRAAFYREHTHDTCDPRQTVQLSPDSVDAVDAALAEVAASGVTAMSVELSENIPADQRAIHVEIAASEAIDDAVARAVAKTRLTGATAAASDGKTAAAGDPIVTDPLSAITEGRTQSGVLRRHPQAFFQGNRFLIGSLVTSVLDVIHDAGPVVDLYAGVGLFSVSLAACGRSDVTAVEGSRVGAADLERNAAQFADRVRVSRESVESFLQRRSRRRAATLILDPPRTGMSREASDLIVRSGVPRIVYVSCDAPTLARDARRLLDAGYRLTSVQGFDLFPNTAHVETLAVFDR